VALLTHVTVAQLGPCDKERRAFYDVCWLALGLTSACMDRGETTARSGVNSVRNSRAEADGTATASFLMAVTSLGVRAEAPKLRPLPPPPAILYRRP